MSALQARSLFLPSSSSTSSRRCSVRNLLRVPTDLRGLPKLPQMTKQREDPIETGNRQSPAPAMTDELAIRKMYAVLEAIADRAEMHAIIGEQRNNWNHLFTNAVNSITLSASLMAGIASIPAAGEPLAFKLSSAILFTAATGIMMITSKIQPSQLAEEQRNATRLWKQLGRAIETDLGHRSPTDCDVEEAVEKMLALEKAYPLPLLPGMLEKFPAVVEPTRWWPKIQPRKFRAGNGSNGWSKELEEELRGALRVLKVKDEEEYTKLSNLALNVNKALATAGPLLAGAAAISSSLMGSPALGPAPAFVSVVGGVLAATANTLEHGGQVGMVFELFRNCAGFYRRLREEIESNLEEEELDAPAMTDELAIRKMYAVLEAIADRAEMHAIIGEQRNNWNHLFTNAVNSITLSASLMAGIASIPAAGEPLAFKLSSAILFTAATGIMMITSKIQPSQLAEEQRNATRLWKQLGRAIETDLGHRSPTDCDVEEAVEKMLALEKAYPLPLLPGMLEKFPAVVEPTRWWPKIQPRKFRAGNGSNGWSKELEEELRGALRVLKVKDEEEYTKLSNLALNVNKALATAGPLLAGAAAISSSLMGSPALGPAPAFVSVVGGVLAATANTLEHGGQVGMVFELFRNCAGFYRRLREEIESNLEEEELERRENGEVFEMKMALQLGRSVSELRELAAYASPSRKDEEDVKECAGKLF
ncbi:uncharacterized protein LOC141834013 [Curcuma longa]|uniref:uncharacterized protein LOC141834013 n=1 Tax=Curcuma longa TaxID=136217 RepID=UPI003D9F93FD